MRTRVKGSVVSLLASSHCQNLSSRFMGERGETIAELLTKPAAAKEAKQ